MLDNYFHEFEEVFKLDSNPVNIRYNEESPRNVRKASMVPETITLLEGNRIRNIGKLPLKPSLLKFTIVVGFSYVLDYIMTCNTILCNILCTCVRYHWIRISIFCSVWSKC